MLLRFLLLTVSAALTPPGVVVEAPSPDGEGASEAWGWHEVVEVVRVDGSSGGPSPSRSLGGPTAAHGVGVVPGGLRRHPRAGRAATAIGTLGHLARCGHDAAHLDLPPPSRA